MSIPCRMVIILVTISLAIAGLGYHSSGYKDRDCLRLCTEGTPPAASSSSSPPHRLKKDKKKGIQWEVDVIVGSTTSLFTEGNLNEQQQHYHQQQHDNTIDFFNFKLSQRLPFMLSIEADVEIPVNVSVAWAFTGQTVNLTFDRYRLKPRCEQLSGSAQCPRCGYNNILYIYIGGWSNAIAFSLSCSFLKFYILYIFIYIRGRRFISSSSYSDSDCICAKLPCPLCIGTGKQSTSEIHTHTITITDIFLFLDVLFLIFMTAIAHHISCTHPSLFL